MLSTDRGSLTSVTDNGDGTYTATLTSTTAGAAHVTGTLNGSALSGRDRHVHAGRSRRGHSTLSGSPASLAAGATSTVTVRLKDQYGNALTAGGDTVHVSTDLGSLGAVTDNRRRHLHRDADEHAAPAPRTSARPSAAARSRARPSRSSPARCRRQRTRRSAAAPTSLSGHAASTVTVHLKDQYGNALAHGGDTVVLGTDLGTRRPASPTTVTAPTPRRSPRATTGTAHVGGTVDGDALARATRDVHAGRRGRRPVDAQRRARVARRPTAAATVTVRLKDAVRERARRRRRHRRALDRPRLALAVTDNGDGTYTATLTSTTSTAPRTSPAPSTATRSPARPSRSRRARPMRRTRRLSAAPTSLAAGSTRRSPSG